MVARMLTATQIAALRLPTVEEIHNVAAAIPQVERGTWRQWDARPGTFLEIAPGMIRITRSAAHLEDAARDRVLHARYRDSKSQLAMDRALYRSPMSLLSDKDVERVAADVAGEPLGAPLVEGKRITAWSRKSRSRMNQQLRRFDYTKLFEDGLEPAMVTLTMPGKGNDGDPDYWQQLAPTPAAFKRMIDRFTTMYRNAWGARPVGVWKMEFQSRGAPHVHILMTPPAGLSRGATGIGGLEFRPWLSRAWAGAVGATGEALIRHERAGTAVDYVGEGYRDPQRIATYFGKHGFFGAKEYQNELPAIWLDAIADGARGARFWGSWGLPKASAVLQLDDVAIAHHSRIIGEQAADAEERQPYSTPSTVLRAYQRAIDGHGSSSPVDVRVMRHLRKLSRSLAHRGVQHERNKYGQPILPPERIRRVKYDKTDPVTGEVRTVKHYRIGYYHGGAGFVLVNDGRVSGRDIHRLLDHRARWTLGA